MFCYVLWVQKLNSEFHFIWAILQVQGLLNDGCQVVLFWEFSIQFLSSGFQTCTVPYGELTNDGHFPQTPLNTNAKFGPVTSKSLWSSVQDWAVPTISNTGRLPAWASTGRWATCRWRWSTPPPDGDGSQGRHPGSASTPFSPAGAGSTARWEVKNTSTFSRKTKPAGQGEFRIDSWINRWTDGSFSFDNTALFFVVTYQHIFSLIV